MTLIKIQPRAAVGLEILLVEQEVGGRRSRGRCRGRGAAIVATLTATGEDGDSEIPDVTAAPAKRGRGRGRRNPRTADKEKDMGTPSTEAGPTPAAIGFDVDIALHVSFYRLTL
ncbi:hypothetical protein BYT27DRAFT_7261942 [Phlegmacium glaucopus]|nr:hypothetical protein BYT27DRAFT_7261942 [Phlegmacium glaucopus]